MRNWIVRNKKAWAAIVLFDVTLILIEYVVFDSKKADVMDSIGDLVAYGPYSTGKVRPVKIILCTV